MPFTTSNGPSRFHLFLLPSATRSIFLSLLDNTVGGFFQIFPSSPSTTSKQFYWPETNILVSRFLCEEGVAQVIDFMPVKGTMKNWRNGVVRIVEGVRGDLEIRMRCFPSFDYARQPHHTRIVLVDTNAQPLVLFQSSYLTMALVTTMDEGCTAVKFTQSGAGVEALFVIKECQRICFELCECHSATHDCFYTGEGVYDPGVRTGSDLDPSVPLPLDEAVKLFQSHTRMQSLFDVFKNNIHFWRSWLSQCTYRGLWQERVHRSALVLKLLTFEKTGAILAALTFGLPEELGGERNWDYRYTWIRGFV